MWCSHLYAVQLLWFRFRHYLNLDKTEGKLTGLFSNIRFGMMTAVLNANNHGWQDERMQGALDL